MLLRNHNEPDLTADVELYKVEQSDQKLLLVPKGNLTEGNSPAKAGDYLLWGGKYLPAVSNVKLNLLVMLVPTASYDNKSKSARDMNRVFYVKHLSKPLL